MIKKSVSFLEGKRVWVVGHADPVGSAIVHRLWREPCEIVLTARSQLDLLRQADVEEWMRKQRPDVVFLTDHRDDPHDPRSSASKLQKILMVNCNVVSTAHEIGVEALVNVSAAGLLTTGPDPGTDAALRNTKSGKVGPCSAARCIALRLTTAYSRQYGHRFVALLANNVYGPDDDSGSSQTPMVLSVASIVQRLAVAAFREEPKVTLLDEGGVTYGLIHLEDLADAAVFLAEEYSGHDMILYDAETAVSFRDLALLVAEIVGFRGDLVLKGPSVDQDVDLAEARFRRIDTLGWESKVMLRHGIKEIHSQWLKYSGERVSAD